MSAAARAVTPKLGIVFPDDPVDSEVLRLAGWLQAKGADVTALVERSQATGGHFHDGLLKTGSLDALAGPAQKLAGLGCGAIMWCCTSGSFIGGLAWARNQSRELAKATGLRTSSTTLAFVEAARAMRATRVDLLAAYPEAVTAELRKVLRDSGIEVVNSASLDCPDGSASWRLDIEAEVARFTETHRSQGHPLLVPDTAIDTLRVIESLERIAQRPVITANQVTVWQGIRLLERQLHVEGAGTLLRMR